MKTEIFNIKIPEHLIAQAPTTNRSDSRLLVYNREKGQITDSYTKELERFLTARDFLVFNNSKVIPARLKISKSDNQKKGELLILKVINSFEALVIFDKAKKYPLGTKFNLTENTIGEIIEEVENSVKRVKCFDPFFTMELLEKHGFVPLPRYIKKGVAEKIDKERYQTVYSSIYGSSAAPTAGLHFDEKIFTALLEKGINHAYVALHVGLGTFKPIYAEEIEDHHIHSEEYFIEEKNSHLINEALQDGKRIIPVGTTSLRTLETAFTNGFIKSGSGCSTLYIYPSYNFKVAAGLITNFHTPKSSLLVLVAAMLGVPKLLEIYDYAVQKEYRFFSYGDAMLIL